MRRAVLSAALLSLAACVIPRTVDRLQERCPPPEFGRPGWVRACAGTGAWVGGVLGGVVSVVLLPVTWPLSLLAEDGLGEAGSEELMFLPAVGGAALGHFLIGGPPDLIDHVFRRAWFTEPVPENTFELVPMEPPAGMREGSGPPLEGAAETRAEGERAPADSDGR